MKKSDRVERVRLWASAMRKRRSGNVMILIGAITLGIIIAVILFALDYNQFLGASHQHLSAVEASGLAAAQDLSRIVIRDQNCGYIALTDYPPIGAGTVAPDGRPVPVTGINTLLGTARLDCLIANQMQNPELVALANNDAKNANAAAHNLQKCLVAAISNQDDSPGSTQPIAGKDGSDPSGATWFTDMDGNVVTPYPDAKKVYTANLVSMANGGKPVVNSFDIKLGYLAQGGGTLTQVPSPQDRSDLNQVNSNQRQGKYYKAFIDVPVSGNAHSDFYFAGLSAQPALIDARQCIVPGTGTADDYTTEPRFCSAVKVTAQHQFEKAEGVSEQIFTTIACAEPSGTVDTTPPGVMTLGFPDGLVPGLNTIGDLMDNSKLNGTGSAGQANGDWPYEKNSTISTTVGPGGTVDTAGNPITSPSAADMFANAFYGWIKTGRTRPDIQALLDLKTLPLNGIMIGGTASTTVAMKPQSQFKFDLMQAAYASPTAQNDGTILTGIMSPDTNLSARWQTLQQNTDPLTKQAYNQVANYTSVTNCMSDNCAKVLMDPQGNMKSTTGDALSLTDVQLFWQKVQETLCAAYESQAVAQNLLTAAVPPTGAAQVAANAKAVIKQANDLIKNQAGYTEDGIKNNGDGTFNVGGATVAPHTVAALLNNLGIASGSASNTQCNTPWNQSGFYFFDSSKAHGGNNAAPTVNPWRVGLLEFDATGKVVFSTLPSTPFNGLPVGDKGVYAVAFQAIQTAGNVVWIATERNYVANIGGEHDGQPMAGTPVDWCTNATLGFSDTIAASKAKGPSCLGIKVADYGGDQEPPPYNNNCGAHGSHGSHGSHAGKAQGGLQGGTGPESAFGGDGNINDDKQGYPWGLKGPNNLTGASWDIATVKYQFPNGNKEVQDCNISGSGKSLGPLRDELNSGNVIASLGSGATGTAALSGFPSGPFATFTTTNDTNLKVQPRANYLCGGIASDFQIRSPFVSLSNLNSTTNGLNLVPGSGQVSVAGLNTPINISGLNANVVLSSGSNNGVADIGDTSLTSPLPKQPKKMD